MSRFCTALCSEKLKGNFIWTVACLSPQSKVALISIAVNVTRCQWSMQSVLVAVMFGVKPKLDTNDKYQHDRLMGTCWPENHSAEVNTYSTQNCQDQLGLLRAGAFIGRHCHCSKSTNQNQKSNNHGQNGKHISPRAKWDMLRVTPAETPRPSLSNSRSSDFMN